MIKKDRLLDNSFFKQPPLVCARELIGCRFVWHDCAGVIVETEAYLSEGDSACHTHFRPSARRFVADHEAGTAYVYLNYGVHWLFNLLVKGGSESGFVLFRAMEPVDGLGKMRSRRKRNKAEQLCSGPGKLTQAFGIDGGVHGVEVLAGDYCSIVKIWDEPAPLSCRRIGISTAQEFPWRYVRKGSRALSAPPQIA